MFHMYYIQLTAKQNAEILPNKQDREDDVKKAAVLYTQHEYPT